MIAQFVGNQRLLAGWTESPAPHGVWGGYLVFRELIQYPDGTLGMKWPEEMIPASGSPLEWKLKFTCNEITQTENTVTIKTIRLSKSKIENLPLSYHFSADIIPGEIINSFGIQFFGNNKDQDGCEIRFKPKKKHAQWGSTKVDGIAGFIAYEDNRYSPYHPMYGVDFALVNVEGLNEPFKLDIIVKYDTTSNVVLIDACIDVRRTMIAHRYNLKSKSVYLFATNGEVDFKNVLIRPLL